jgi:hypothetical protein
VAALERGLEEPRCFGASAVTMRGMTAARATTPRAPEALRAGRSTSAVPSRNRQSKKKYGKRQLAPHRIDLELAAKTPHRELKRKRRRVGAKRDRLAVEYQRLRAASAHQLDDLRHPRAHVVEVARVDAHLVARLVNLHARAVELPLERGGAQLLAAPSCVSAADCDSIGSTGRIRRTEERARAARRLRRARRGLLRVAAGGHRRFAHVVDRQARSLRNRFQHQRPQRALRSSPTMSRTRKSALAQSRAKTGARAVCARFAAAPLPFVAASASNAARLPASSTPAEPSREGRTMRLAASHS